MERIGLCALGLATCAFWLTLHLERRASEAGRHAFVCGPELGGFIRVLPAGPGASDPLRHPPASPPIETGRGALPPCPPALRL